MQDIVAELRLLLRSAALPPQERLRVLLTATEMLQRQVGPPPASFLLDTCHSVHITTAIDLWSALWQLVWSLTHSPQS